jgi:hypothetical protein
MEAHSRWFLVRRSETGTATQLQGAQENHGKRRKPQKPDAQGNPKQDFFAADRRSPRDKSLKIDYQC